MRCSRCGKELEENAPVCDECGAPVSCESDVTAGELSDRDPNTETEEGASVQLPVPVLPPENTGEWHGPGETVSVPDTAEEKRGKGPRAVAAVIAAFLVLCIIGAGGYWYWYSLPKNRAERLMRSAETHLAASEIVEAASDYRAVLEIIPDLLEAQNRLYTIWSEEVTAVMDLVDSGKFEEALERARILPQIDPERETMNHSALTVIYKEWASDLAGNDDPDGVEKLLSSASEELSESEIIDIRQSVVDTLRYFAVLKELRTDSEELILLSADEEVSAVFEKMSSFSEKFAEFVDLGGSVPFRYAPEGSETALAFYRYMSDCQLVVGSIDEEGRPEGTATAYYAELFGEDGQFLFCYTCGWEQGRPNGPCVYHELGADVSDSSDDIVIKGDLIDGLWDGETEELFRDGETYFITYSKGRVKILSDNGPDANVVGYNKDNTKMISFSDSAVSGQLGVPFIYIY